MGERLTDEQVWLSYHCALVARGKLIGHLELADQHFNEFRERFPKTVSVEQKPRPPKPFLALPWRNCNVDRTSFEATKDCYFLTVNYKPRSDKQDWEYQVTRKRRIFSGKLCITGYSTSEEGAKSKAEYEVYKQNG